MKKLLLVFLFFTYVNFSFAAIYVEPLYFQTPRGNVDAKETPSGSNIGYETQTEGFGGRIGFTGDIQIKGSKNARFIIGIEYLKTQSKWEFKKPALTRENYKTSGIGLYDRVAAEHYGVHAANRIGNFFIFMGASAMKFRDFNEDSPLNKGDYYIGTSLNYGMGYALFNYLKISLEFRQYDIKTFYDSSTQIEYELPHLTQNLGRIVIKELMWVVSIPFEIF